MKSAVKLNGSWLIAAAVASMLAACGGSPGNTVPASGSITNVVTPSTVTSMVAGQRIALEAKATAAFNAVASQAWTITQLSGDTPATAPVLQDAACANASVTVGYPANGSTPGRNGTALCQTYLVLPADLPTSEWSVENTARTATSSASGKFVLKVTAGPKVDKTFTLNVPSVPQAFTTDTTATLNAGYLLGTDARLDKPVSFEWSQVSGPAVAIAGASTSAMSFIPRTAGDYAFKVKATAVIGGQTYVREGAMVATAQAPDAVHTYQISAGALQAVDTGATVTLAGAVTGDVPSAELSYRWLQMSGPAAVLFGDNTLAPQFVARTAGDYVFQLTVNRSGKSPSFKTANTQVTVADPQVAKPYFTVTTNDAMMAALNSVVQLKGQVVAGTPAPTNLSYQWVQTSGPAASLANPNSLVASFVPGQAGTYKFDFTATSQGVSKTSSSIVTVASAPSSYFAVSAGVLQSSPVNVAVTLQGTVTGTVPSQNLSYKWTQTSGPEVTLYRADTLTPQFLPTQAGDYAFNLAVTQAADLPVTQSSGTLVVVYSTDSSSAAPFFGVSAGDAQIVSIDTAAVLKGAVVTGQPAPTNIDYKWVQLSGPAVTLANDQSLTASFVAPSDGLYTFELSATAGGVTKKAVTSVYITPSTTTVTPPLS